MCRRTTRSENFAQAIRAIGEPIHNRTAERISMAKLLTLLARGHRPVRHADPPELILLQKTMVVVEGVARGFDPKLDIWKVADPWCANGSSAISARSAASRARWPAPASSAACWPACRRCAARGDRARAAGEHDAGGLTLSPETIAALGRAEAARPLAHRGALDHRATFIGISVAVRQL
jgi:ubiquinone biosynthesis protein